MIEQLAYINRTVGSIVASKNLQTYAMTKQLLTAASEELEDLYYRLVLRPQLITVTLNSQLIYRVIVVITVWITLQDPLVPSVALPSTDFVGLESVLTVSE